MLGRSMLNSTTSSDSRMFVYEVAGLRQGEQTDLSTAQIRHSSNQLFPVPFSRMNEFMQRMTRLGGQIVAIHSSMAAATAETAEAAEAEAE